LQIDEACARLVQKVQQFRDSYAGPDADSKYLLQTSTHVGYARNCSKYFSRVRSLFEIGPGPGFLLALLHEQGKIIGACDARNSPRHFFVHLRTALGVQQFVIQNRVTAFQPIPIPSGTESLAAIYTGIDRTWGVREHEWFLDECSAKLSGAKRLVFGFQWPDPNTSTQKLYRSIGVFPDTGGICVVDL
jgi:hypothetical protein